MTRSRQRSKLVLLGVASLALAMFVGFSIAPARKRDRAIARFQEPAALTSYRQLMAEAQTGVNAQGDVPLRVTEHETGRDQDTNETLARWERVFAQWDDLVAEGNWAELCKKALQQKYPRIGDRHLFYGCVLYG